VRHGTDPPVSTALPAREAVAAPAQRTVAVDGPLVLGALVTSAAALAVLAGTPSADTAAGDAVRALVLLAFWLVAPGAVVVTRLRLPGLTRVATTPLVGLALLTLTATVGTWTGLWVPRASAALVAVATLAAAALSLWRGHVRLPVGAPRRPRPAAGLLVLALLVGVGLWAASLPAVRAARPSVYGLLVAGPWTLPAAFLVVAGVLLLALRGRSPYVAAAAVLGLVLVLRTTASAGSPVPIASWTYKHLGVVRALQDTHQVAGGTDIYMNWPGMFAAGAWFSDASGVEVVDLARWTAPVVHLLLALGTAALARALGARTAGCTAAAGLVVVVNWVGQDYFAPQALAMCLATGVVVLLVGSSASRASAVLALALFPAIVVTHQLTPFWLLALAVLLVVLRRAPWWLAAGMALVVGAYLLTRLDLATAYGLFDGFDPLANAQSGAGTLPAPGQQVGGVFAKAGSLLMWGSTLAVLAHRASRLGWRRGWRSPDVLVPGVVAFSPFLLLAGQSYGGEANLRVTLYSAIGCCAVLGPALVAALRRSPASALAAAAWTTLVLVATAQASFQMWSLTLIRPEDVAAAQELVQEHPEASVVPLINVWPGRTSVDYERYIGPFTRLEPGLDEILRDDGGIDPTASIPLDPADVARVAQDLPGEATYVVTTGSMRGYDAYYATYAPGTYQETLQQLTRSPDWEVVRHSGDLWVLRYLGPAAPAA
jgi:hypothetical protein